MALKKKKKIGGKKKRVKKSAIKRTLKKARKIAKKTSQKKREKKTTVPKIARKEVGVVTHYFPKVCAAVIKLKSPLAIGDIIKVKGHTTDFTQKVTSIQIDHVPVTETKKGQEIGLLVESRVRKKDMVYKE